MTRALVFGRAQGVWDEMVAARKLLGRFDLVIGVGHAVCDYPGHVDHWVSFHTELLYSFWVKTRRERGFTDVANFWTALSNGRVRSTLDGIKTVSVNGGSSGLIAAMVAVGPLAVDRVVLCGIPMQPSPQYDNPMPWREAEKHQAAWQAYLPQLAGRVKSMSGWTRELLGAPTREWLNG